MNKVRNGQHEQTAFSADEMIERLRRRDKNAFEEFVELYAPRVGRLAFRLCPNADEAEDVVQDVFLAAWRHAGQIKSQDHAWAYLAAVTANKCRTVFRKRRISLRHLIGLMDSREKSVPSVQELLRQGETAAAVRRVVRALPPKLREVAVFRYLEEMDIERIAEVLGMARNTVEVRLHRARTRLRDALGPHVEE